MTVTHQRLKMVKSCFKILFCIVVFRSYLHINELRQITSDAGLQGDKSATGNLDSIRGDDVLLQRGTGELQDEKFAFRHLMGMHINVDENCTKRGISSFWTFFSNEQRLNGAIIIHFLVAFYMCGMIGYNCDIYFVPALEVICEELQIQPDVAGATFMAAGSSAPEFFTALIGTFISEDDTALSAIVGSAAFNVFIIISFCCFFAGKDVPLTWFPLFRDGVCYILSVLLLVVFIYDSEVQWWEGLIMTFAYFLYILLMYFNPYLSEQAARVSCRRQVQQDKQSLIEKNNFDRASYGASTEETHLGSSPPKGMEKDGKGVESCFSTERERDENHASMLSEDPMDGPTAEYKESQEEVPAVFAPPQNIAFRLLWIIGLPTVVLMFITIPDCRKPRWRKYFFVSFFMSLLWLMGTSYVLYWMIVVMGYTFGIPDTVMGISLLAAGTSVPDLISSVIVTRHGFGDMALSNVIGSNIFDVLICLGLLWFLKGAVADPVTIATDGLTFTSITLMLTVAIVVIAIHINGWKLDMKLGFVCLTVYLAFIVLAILRELGELGNVAPPFYCDGPK